MCNLRGLLMLKLNRGDQAKACFMEALALDVKCYDAFEQLVGGEMMTVNEGTPPPLFRYPLLPQLFSAEWEFVQSLAYKEQTPEDAEFVCLVYTSRLRKYKHAEEHALTRRRLVEEFGLSDNPDVLYSFADALYAQFRWSDCYAITSRYELFCCAVGNSALMLLQNIRLGSGAHSHNAFTYCLYASSTPFTLEALHTRA
jgi:anaphase-promoting complex subunit 6